MKRLLLLLLAPLLACAQPSTPINNPRLQGTGYVVTGASLSAQGTGTITATAMSNSTTMSMALDLLGSTRGSVLYRGASGWTILAPGTAGYVLATGGTGADPYWAAGGGGSPGGSNGQIQYNAAGSFGGFTMSGDATVNTGTGALTLANSGVSAGTYGSTTTIPAITIDAKGRITASSNSTPAFLPLVGGTLTGNLTFSDAGEGMILSGGASVLATDGAIGVTASGTNQSVFLTPSGTGNISMVGPMALQSGTSPTTSVAGHTAFDTNAWGSGRGAVQVYDGTGNTYLLGALASDTPSSGQVPTWNTGGTITWETPSTGSGNVTGGSLTANAVIIGGGSNAISALGSLGTSGAPLLSAGAGAPPAFGAIALGGGASIVSGTLPIGNGGTGATSTSQNFAFIGPTSGSGAPSFRALVAGDIPSLSGTYLPLAGGTMTGNITFNDTGEGLNLHGGGNITGASGNVSIASSASSNNVNVTGAFNGTQTAQATFAGTFTAPANDNFHFWQWSPTITSAGTSTDIRALSMDSVLAGSTDAAAIRAVRLRAMTDSGASANVTTLQGISASQTHQGSGTITEMIGYAGSMNVNGSGNVTNAYYFLTQVPSFTSTGVVTSSVRGFWTKDVGNATKISGAAYAFSASDITKPTGNAYGFHSDLGAGSGGKYAFYGAGTAPSYFGGDVALGSILSLYSAASPTTSTAGYVAFDNNAWDTGRGAIQAYDGTANTYVVAALASDTPSNGQVPTWKTGGTVEWETPSGSGNVTGGSLTANAVVVGGGSNAVTVLASLGNSGAPLLSAGAGAPPAFGALNLAGGSNIVTGALPVANGGTGATTLTSNAVITGNGTGAVTSVSPGTTGNVLTSNGTAWTSAAPSGGGKYTMTFCHAITNPGDGLTYYSGGLYASVAQTTNGNDLCKLPIPISGTITNATYKVTVAGTLGSSENVTVELFYAGTTAIGSATMQFSSMVNTATATGISQAVTAGDFLVARWVSPVWTTNPTSVILTTQVTISL